MKISLLLFIVLLTSCARAPELVIADEKKDKIFSQFINPVEDRYKLPKLRETSLSGEDLEVRVWWMYFETDGFILKRIDGIWDATAIKENDCKKYSYFPKDKPYQLGKIKLSTPKSGWKSAWQKLAEAGILDLPDSDERRPTLDGVIYSVETNQNGIYRMYQYTNPEFLEKKEAVQMLKIGEIIADEFGLYNFKFGSLCLEK